MTQNTCVLPCKSTKQPQAPADTKEAPGTHHFNPPTAEADLQPAAQELHQHQQHNSAHGLSRQQQQQPHPKPCYASKPTSKEQQSCNSLPCDFRGAVGRGKILIIVSGGSFGWKKDGLKKMAAPTSATVLQLI